MKRNLNRLERLENTIKSTPYHVIKSVGRAPGSPDDDGGKLIDFIFWDVFNSAFNTPAGRNDWWRREHGTVPLPPSWSQPGKIDQPTFLREFKGQD